VLVLDGEGRVLRLNPAGLEIAGGAARDIVGRPVGEAGSG
jgi:PAS domain-containing protein